MINIKTEFGKPNKDEWMCIYIRINQGTEKRRIKTPYKIHKSKIDQNGNINDLTIDFAVSDLINKYKGMLIQAGAAIATWTIEDYYDYLTGETNKQRMQREEEQKRDSFELDFISYYWEQVRKMSREGKDKTAQGYNTALNHIKDYTKGKPIDVNDMNKNWVKGLIDHMRDKKVGEAGIERYMAYNNAVLNKAKSEYNDPDDDAPKIKRSPFDATREMWAIPSVKKNERMETNYITLKAIRYMLTLPPVEEKFTGTANIAWRSWLLSFGLCGMNAKDMYELESLNRDGKVEYLRSKTAERSKNSKIILAINPLLREVHESLLGRFESRVWMFAERWRALDNMYQGCNGGLRNYIHYAVGCYADEHGISREKAQRELELPDNINDISFYSARHSWANIAANECGISTDVIDRALCHSGKNMAERSYIKTDFTVIDEANNKVLEKVFAE